MAVNQLATFFEVLQTRHSVRDFSDRPVERALLTRLLEAATLAPNAHNRQPWRFVVLTTPAGRIRLVEAMAPDYRSALEGAGLSEEDVATRMQSRAERIGHAPVVVLLCYAAEDMDSYPEDPNRHQGEQMMGVQSVALAGGHLLLAAHAEGLGGVWMCAPLFAPDGVRQVFELSATWRPQGLILLGYPDKISRPRERKPLDEVTWFVE